MPTALFHCTRRRVLVAACAAPLAAAAPLRAQTSDPEALGTALAHELMTAADFRGVFVRALAQPHFAEVYGLQMRPGWESWLREAAAEEVDHDMPELERLAGHAFALRFTTLELQALLAFLERPAGQALLAYVAGDAAGQAPPPPSGETRAEIEQFLATPEGASIQAKFEDMGPLAEALEQEFLEELAPGVVERFNEKSEAAGQQPPPQPGR